MGEGAVGVRAEEDEQDVGGAVEGVPGGQRLLAGEQLNDGPVAVQPQALGVGSYLGDAGLGGGALEDRAQRRHPLQDLAQVLRCGGGRGNADLVRRLPPPPRTT